MAYGYVLDVPAPIEFYDALHAEIARRTTSGVDGMLLHIGRVTRGGYQVIEVWQSKEVFDRFNAEVIAPALTQLSGGQPPPHEPTFEEFEPRGLIVPAAQVAV
jgi:hypothetical protein